MNVLFGKRLETTFDGSELKIISLPIEIIIGSLNQTGEAHLYAWESLTAYSIDNCWYSQLCVVVRSTNKVSTGDWIGGVEYDQRDNSFDPLYPHLISGGHLNMGETEIDDTNLIDYCLCSIRECEPTEKAIRKRLRAKGWILSKNIPKKYRTHTW